MPVTTLPARQFTRDLAAAKQAAQLGPVVVTERGKPAFALLTIQEYYRITGTRERSLLDLMHAMPSTSAESAVELDAEQINIELQVPNFE